MHLHVPALRRWEHDGVYNEIALPICAGLCCGLIAAVRIPSPARARALRAMSNNVAHGRRHTRQKALAYYRLPAAPRVNTWFVPLLKTSCHKHVRMSSTYISRPMGSATSRAWEKNIYGTRKDLIPTILWLC